MTDHKVIPDARQTWELYADKAEERFQWACALAYAYDNPDTEQAQTIRKAWGEYHRHYWVPVVANSYNRVKPEIPDYPNKVES